MAINFKLIITDKAKEDLKEIHLQENSAYQSPYESHHRWPVKNHHPSKSY